MVCGMKGGSLSLFFMFLCLFSIVVFFFFFNDTATTEIYTLSLHDALPICEVGERVGGVEHHDVVGLPRDAAREIRRFNALRSEEHTSELQSLAYLVCRLLLEKKKKKQMKDHIDTDSAKVHATTYIKVRRHL